MAIDFKFLFDTFFVALSGVPTTMIITIVSLLIAIPVGFFIALSRINEVKILSKISKIYISFIRGTPIIVQIFIAYNSIPILLQIIFTKFNININIYDVNPIWYAMIVFSLNTSAGISEIFRSALVAVNKGQFEAAQSVGLTNVQCYKNIIIPQALVIVLPNLCTATTNLIKATSLCYAMSLSEITLRAKVAANVNYNYIEAYIAIFLVYLILCSLVEFGFKLYEKKVRIFKVA